MILYAIMPVEKSALYTCCDTQFGRLSLDRKYLVWSEDWSPAMLEALRADSEVLTLGVEDVIVELAKANWTRPDREE